MSKAELTNLEKLVVEIHDAGQEWIEAKLKADQLDKDEKNLLAAIMNGLEEAAKEKTSESKLERLARGSPDFRNYVTHMCLARAEAERKKVRYENLNQLFEAKRSSMALERAKVERGIFDRGK